MNNQVRNQTRKVIKTQERLITENVKDNPKIFWKHVQTKVRTKSRVSDLYVDEEKKEKAVNSKEKAEVLASFFSSVFTREPTG